MRGVRAHGRNCLSPITDLPHFVGRRGAQCPIHNLQQLVVETSSSFSLLGPWKHLDHLQIPYCSSLKVDHTKPRWRYIVLADS